MRQERSRQHSEIVHYASGVRNMLEPHYVVLVMRRSPKVLQSYTTTIGQ